MSWYIYFLSTFVLLGPGLKTQHAVSKVRSLEASWELQKLCNQLIDDTGQLLKIVQWAKAVINRDGFGQNPTRAIFSRTRGKFFKTRVKKSWEKLLIFCFFIYILVIFCQIQPKLTTKCKIFWPELNLSLYFSVPMAARENIKIPETWPKQNQKTRNPTRGHKNWPNPPLVIKWQK